MIARGAESEINVIALIGERGRELREFIEKDLGPEGMARSIIVVSTSDQPALIRRRAAHIATAIAEHFREEGKKVLFMMDSVTRYAMAQREIALAIGLLRGEDLSRIHQRAVDVAAFVCTKAGATPELLPEFKR